MNDPTECPECDSWKTETMDVKWYEITPAREMVCYECSTRWTISYADPVIEHVEHIQKYE